VIFGILEVGTMCYQHVKYFKLGCRFLSAEWRLSRLLKMLETPKAYSKLVGGFKHEVYFPLYMG